MLVMASLASGAKHGHAMLDDIERMGGGRLGPGTLYGAIARLEKQGWIEALAMEDRRRPYRLTQAGFEAFSARISTLRHFVAASEQRLGIA
jgi:DNA-binding PadR family transcriptional regulator